MGVPVLLGPRADGLVGKMYVQFSNISYLTYKNRLAHWYDSVSEALWWVYILAAWLLFLEVWFLHYTLR